MKLAIIGAGPTGLIALRHSLDEGHDCEVFEKTDNVGGTWAYTEKTGNDEYGLPIHSSMYADLKTNLPKEIMGCESYPYRKPYESFISHQEVFQYLQNFAQTFKLLPHIKFHTHVVRVNPLKKNKWNVRIQNLKTKNIDEKIFDAVVLCNGRFSVPNMPHFNGLVSFKGSVTHSHDYRTPDQYKMKKVLVIGSGPSGRDISQILLGTAAKVVLSTRDKCILNSDNKIITKPPIKKFRENSVIFTDETDESIDCVIFCTGYLESFPFLTPNCGIEIENNFVKYLYKYVINVRKPTMAILGYPDPLVLFPTYSLQIKFFLSYLKGNFTVTETDMMRDVMRKAAEVNEKDDILKYYQTLSKQLEEYLGELADIANMKRAPSVFAKLYSYHVLIARGDRTAVYRIVDDNKFVRIDNNENVKVMNL